MKAKVEKKEKAKGSDAEKGEAVKTITVETLVGRPVTFKTGPGTMNRVRLDKDTPSVELPARCANGSELHALRAKGVVAVMDSKPGKQKKSDEKTGEDAGERKGTPDAPVSAKS